MATKPNQSRRALVKVFKESSLLKGKSEKEIKGMGVGKGMLNANKM